MHEITLCQSILEIIEQQVRSQQVNRVTAVWLEMGALSCVEESALRFCFDVVCRRSIAEGCTLHITTVPAKAWCWHCCQEITLSTHDGKCPHCQGYHLKVNDGENLQLKQIEIE